MAEGITAVESVANGVGRSVGLVFVGPMLGAAVESPEVQRAVTGVTVKVALGVGVGVALGVWLGLKLGGR